MFRRLRWFHSGTEIDSPRSLSRLEVWGFRSLTKWISKVRCQTVPVGRHKRTEEDGNHGNHGNHGIGWNRTGQIRTRQNQKELTWRTGQDTQHRT